MTPNRKPPKKIDSGHLGRIPPAPAPAPIFEAREELMTASTEPAPMAEPIMERPRPARPQEREAATFHVEGEREPSAAELEAAPGSENGNGRAKPTEPAPRAGLFGAVRSAWTTRFTKPSTEATLAAEVAAESQAEAAADATPAPAGPLQLADAETKDLLRRLRKQQTIRMRQELLEAKELDKRARELEKKAKDHRKLRAETAKHSDYVKSLAPKLGFDPDRAITLIPELPPGVSQVEFTTVQEGRSYVRISYDTNVNRYLYEVIEPQLTSTEKEVLEFLRDTMVRTLDGRRASDDAEEWEEFLLDAAERAVLDHSILVDEVSTQRLQYYLVRDFLGYGPIDVVMRDPMIEDISCDGPAIPIYIFHREYESIKTNVAWNDESELDSFVIRLAQRSGKHISIAEPLLDATLPDKSRLQASLAREVTTRGSSFTIRKFRGDPLTPPDLVRLGTMSAGMAAYFWLAMEEGSSLVYAGGTASGKTTTLNAVSLFVPPQKKVVSIEDTREINLPHENWIAGLTRSGFGGEIVGGKVAGTIDMYKLLEAALRQRPEYLIVGEVRGPEALTLFQAMATGHATYSTLHADSVMSAVYRLENPPIGVPRIMLQTLDAMAIQVLARVNHRSVRRIKEVVEIAGIDPQSGDLLTNTVFDWDSADDRHRFTGKSQVLDAIAEKNNMTAEDMEAEMRRRQLVIEWMVEKGIRQIRDVASVVAAYYTTPDALLAKIQGGTAAGAAAHFGSRPTAATTGA